MKRGRKISRKFEPDECSYMIGWVEVFEKPKGAVVRYWRRDRHGNYFGILRFRVNILQTLALLFILYALYVFFFNIDGREVKISEPNVLYMHDGKLAVNINSEYEDVESVAYKIECNGKIIQIGNLNPGESIGTIQTSLSMPAGDYPVIITYVIPGKHKDIVHKSNILLSVQ